MLCDNFGIIIFVYIVKSNDLLFSDGRVFRELFLTNIWRSDTVGFGPILGFQQISATASGLAHSRLTQTFHGTVTVMNVSGSTIPGPFQIVLGSLPSGATLTNATGNYKGAPYVTIPALASLAPGKSATVDLKFKNSSNAVITFSPAIYSGSFN